ncbi:MAG TPA: hypothetical protein VN843_30735 [Anaerolineales bacterium]|nr:hypothetical protein [Anaerolineales bacterium]
MTKRLLETLSKIVATMGDEEQLIRLEHRTVRFTAFILLQLALLGLLIWSVFHFAKFVRASIL